MMDDLEQDSDWDTEEFQAALKTVLKYEIQSLLERLSQTGEETVLLAVNTVDMCVSHLASSNAQKFVNSVDVGQIKTKFLRFVTGQPSGMMGLSKPLMKSDLDCGAFSDSDLNNQEKWGNLKNASKFTGKRVLDTDLPSQETQNAMLKRRKVDDNMTQNHPQFKRNVNVTSTVVAPVTTKTSDEIAKLPLHAGPSDEDNTHDKLQDLAANKGKRDIKLNTTKIVSKSGGFTEERLSDSEFKNLLKLCNSDVENEVGDLPQHKTMTPTGRSQQQQKAFGLGINPKMTSTANAVGSRANVESKTHPLSQHHDLKSEIDKNMKYDKVTNVGNKLRNSAAVDFTKEDGGAVRKTVIPNKASKENDSSKIKIQPLLNMPEIKEEVDPDDMEYRQSEQSQSTTTVASQDKQQPVAGRRQDRQSIQEKENRTEGSAIMNVKDGKPNTQATSLQKTHRPLNEDDLDTETLIRMAKEKHKETQSDADKAIQAKLGQLSSKLSWVVEYPKDKSNKQESWESHPGERTQTKQMLGNPYHGNPMLDEEEEDEEDYDEEDFDDELDEEEIAALKAIHANKLLRLKERGMEGIHPDGNMSGEYGANLRPMMGYHGDYGEDEEGVYDEYGEYNPENMEEMEGEEEGDMEDGGMMGPMGGNYEQHIQHGGNMGAFSDGGMGSYVDGGMQGMSQNQQYQGESSATFDNFLLMGIMAKCLLCNRIIRKTEMQQHNQMHLEEEEEEEHYEEGDEEQWGEQEGGEEEGYNEEDMLPQGDGDCEGQDQDMGQDEYGGEAEHVPEFTAEKFVAEKVVMDELDVSVADGKPFKSTVCDICNKQFKSVSNMQRHRKIHTDQTKYPCQMCEKTFRSSATLLSHVKKKHPDFNTSKDLGLTEENVEKLFQCGVCNDTFTEENSLHEHMESHKDAEW